MKTKPDAETPPEPVRTSAMDQEIDRWFAEFRVGLDVNTHNRLSTSIEELKKRLVALPEE